jgi:hypothetical protein
MKGTRPLRYVVVGGMSGPGIVLPGAVLGAKPIVLAGSGIGSVPPPSLVQAAAEVMRVALPAKLEIATRTVPLAEVAETWHAHTGKDRVVPILEAG